MMYDIIRLGIDGVYTIGKLSYDGVYYMMYGPVKSTDEQVLSKVEDLEKQINNLVQELRLPSAKRLDSIVVQTSEKKGK
jgi:hypothetical protein